MGGLTARVYDSISEVDRNQWNNLITQSGTGSVFHSYEWLSAVECGIGDDPRHAVVSKDGNPLAVCPNFVTEIDVPDALNRLPIDPVFRVLSSIEPGFGGIVFSSKKEMALQKTLSELKCETNDEVVAHRVIVADLEYVQYSYLLSKMGYRPSLNSCRFVLDLTTDWDSLLGGFSTSRRKDIQKAFQGGIKVSIAELDDRTLDRFYDTYQETLARLGGVPYSKQFFARIFEDLESSIQVFSMERDGEIVGEHLYVLDEGRSTMHHLFTAICDEHLQYSPSAVLHGHAIQWGIDSEFEEYDFGSTSGDFRDGIFSFKKQFGGDPIPILQWERGYDPVRWNAYRIGRSAFRRYGDTVSNYLSEFGE
ncbi:GNAT family N-acetyltransferase (plasmid) [Halorussus limi]|uniref:GNAT family N-acetyltransferase n=1 Tax=Halorussus limi TaxID=2938695 RepID=A0A8U0I0T4_9EURY|nr:peptidoglycan bridge formation glycyltransferase FemA/FemB family protein [Halorussus limi]UPV76633.1 GNAT family N-acetyltransferase [Halorussus limi]